MSSPDKYINSYDMIITVNGKIVFSYNLEKAIVLPTTSCPEKKIYFIKGFFLNKYLILLISDRSECMYGEFRLFNYDKQIFRKSGYLKGSYTFIDLDMDISINFSQGVKGEDIGTKIPFAPVGFYAQYRYEIEGKDVYKYIKPSHMAIVVN